MRSRMIDGSVHWDCILYVLFSATNQARNYSRGELIRALDLLMQCNRRLVSSSLDESFVLQQALTQILIREAEAA